MQMTRLCRLLVPLAALAAALARTASADVLPDDRADLFYSKYSGGGMDITGESVSARKKFTENLALDYSYFIDKVSGASVDVLSQASVIKDERKQNSVTATIVHDKTTYALSFSNSIERDYISNTPHASLSQDMFGDLTTITLGFGRTRDKVGENNGTAFVPNVAWLGHAESRSYELGLSQILTRNWIASLNLNVIADDGYLSNPYRAIRYKDPTAAKGYSLGSQVYPDTRTSTAVELRTKYYLPFRAAVSLSYRYFRDTWSIVGNTFEFDYTQPISNMWILEGRIRYYQQTRASFYSDLFAYINEYNYEGRDKDLAASKNYTFGAKATYAFLPEGWKIFKRATFTIDLSEVRFKYLDFTNIKNFNDTPAGGSYAPGAEPLYHFNAFIGQAYLSMFF
ncbi:MAG TPA: DUF3570 domain-containing protein [Steroidobacteraceae bacterium]|nr:DUF3570 domain-containing protein [Steroidobacteraceae bacterium]